MTCWKFIVVNKLNSGSFCNGLLGIHKHVVDSVRTNHFIKTNNALSLFAHGTLEQVSRRLVMVGVRNDSCHNTDDSKRINFHVGVKRSDLVRLKGYVSIILLIDVQELNHPHRQ